MSFWHINVYPLECVGLWIRDMRTPTSNENLLLRVDTNKPDRLSAALAVDVHVALRRKYFLTLPFL